MSQTEISPITIDLPGLIALRHQIHDRRHSPVQARAAEDGHYRSRFRGRGMEFAEVRAYQEGDDVRSIDWRVTARRGKVHTKLFHEERERPVVLIIDYRRPMFFATRGCFKAVQASRMAALFSWEALARGDRIGAFIFSEQHNRELRPKSGKTAVLQVLRQMVENPAWERPAHRPFEPLQPLAATLQRLQRVARPGTLIRFLSDFNQWDEAVERELAKLARHCDLALVHCFDPLEKELPPAGTYRVSNGEADMTIFTASKTAQDHYRQSFVNHRHRIQTFCRQYHCRYLSLETNDDPRICLNPGMGGKQ